MNSLPSWTAPVVNEDYARARDPHAGLRHPIQGVFFNVVVEQPGTHAHLATEERRKPLVERHNIAPDQRDNLEPWRYLQPILDEQTNRLHAQVSPFVGRLTGPVKFLKKLLESWSLSEQEATALLGFERKQTDIVRNILRGTSSLPNKDVKERINVLFDIRKTLDALLRDENVEREWLREEKDLLQGRTPMDLMLKGSFEDLLLVRDFVFHVAGKL